jgi:hypothetical protein|tara:strand:+ start:81 stop:563 length:483 start_codon:yes stop_codon:yes gene_type:complete
MVKTEIIEIDNFISKEESNYFINYLENNFNLEDKKCFKHRETKVIDCINIKDDIEILNLGLKLKKLCKQKNKKYVINYFEIVKWPPKESLPEHVDFDYHPYTSIIYLNDDFTGGETIVGNKTIVPKKCKLIAFEGNKIKHEVNKVTKGTRYTIPCWYKYG